MFKAFVGIFFLSAYGILCSGVQAQVVVPAQNSMRPETSITPDSSIHPEKVEEKDIINVLGQLRKKSKRDSAKAKEAKSGKVLYSLVPAVGYTLSTGFVGLLSANAAFYLSDSAKTNISSVSTSFNYTQYNQITIPVQANVWQK